MNFLEIRQRILDRIQSELPPDWGEFYRSSVGYALVQAIAAEFAYLRQEVAEAFSDIFLSTAQSEAAFLDWAQFFGYPSRRDAAAEVQVSWSLSSAYPPVLVHIFPFDLWTQGMTSGITLEGDPVLQIGDVSLSYDGFLPGPPASISQNYLFAPGGSGTLSLIAGTWRMATRSLMDFLEDPEWLLEGPVDNRRLMLYYRYLQGTQVTWLPVPLYRSLGDVLQYGGLQEVTYQSSSVLIRQESDFPWTWPSSDGLLVAIWFSPYLGKLSDDPAWAEKSWKAFQEMEGVELSGWTLVRDWIPRESVEELRLGIRRWIVSKGVISNAEDIRIFSLKTLPGLIDVSVQGDGSGLIQVSALYRDGGTIRTLNASEQTYLLSRLSEESLPGVTYTYIDPIPRTLSVSLQLTVESSRALEAQEGVNSLIRDFPRYLGKNFPLARFIRELNLIPGILAVSYQILSEQPVTAFNEYQDPSFDLGWEWV